MGQTIFGKTQPRLQQDMHVFRSMEENGICRHPRVLSSAPGDIFRPSRDVTVKDRHFEEPDARTPFICYPLDPISVLAQDTLRLN